MAHKNTDPMKIYQFMASIINASIAHKIAKQMGDTPQMQLDMFKKAEAGLQ